MVCYLNCFQLLILFWMSPKAPELQKYTPQEVSLTYHKKISSQAEEILYDISYWTIWFNIQCALLYSPILTLPIQSFTWWFHLFWFLKSDLTPRIKRDKVRLGRVQGNNQEFISFKHKANQNIGWYTKYLMIFTTYKVQGWWEMILITVKS